MPTLRSSLGYMTTTACVADEGTSATHRMRVVGLSPVESAVYIVEELGDDLPIVYRLALRGPREGHLIPIHAWYEHAPSAGEVRARLAAIEPTLQPAIPTTTEAWMLSTRVVQRRALRVASHHGSGDLPIRKFALQLLVEPVSGHGPSGKTTVTAFLRPHAQLADVLALSNGAAVARVTYCGIPSGVGLSKDTVVLLTSGIGMFVQ